MTVHKHAEMIKAKADNMELVVFVKCGKNDKWKETETPVQFPLSEFDDVDYFACLPQHKEVCLHWLNGGAVQVKYEGDNWKDVFNNENPTWHGVNYFMMRNTVECRIKPRKEKRWIVAKPSALVSMMYFNSKQYADDAVATSTGEFKGGQVIEIEVEI